MIALGSPASARSREARLRDQARALASKARLLETQASRLELARADGRAVRAARKQADDAARAADAAQRQLTIEREGANAEVRSSSARTKRRSGLPNRTQTLGRRTKPQAQPSRGDGAPFASMIRGRRYARFDDDADAPRRCVLSRRQFGLLSWLSMGFCYVLCCSVIITYGKVIGADNAHDMIISWAVAMTQTFAVNEPSLMSISTAVPYLIRIVAHLPCCAPLFGYFEWLQDWVDSFWEHVAWFVEA